MDKPDIKSCTAFDGSRCIASGNLVEVIKKIKETIDQEGQGSVLIFDDFTSDIIEVDFRGTTDDVLKRLDKATLRVSSSTEPFNADQGAKRGPGRPRLGVVSREITLLPRHWDWLNCQPGGASVALRKLVEQARRVNSDRDRVRYSQEAAYKFMSVMAGNLPGFEESTRALFAGNPERFQDLIVSWPGDIRDHAQRLADAAFGNRE
jgi:hypothetical protein